jgi:integrase
MPSGIGGTNDGNAPAAGVTVAAFLTAWLRARRSLRASTLVSYEVHVRRYLIPALGHLCLAELTSREIDAMYAAILDHGGVERAISSTTVRRIHATLMSALSYAVRTGTLNRNPAAYVDLPRSPRVEMQSWSAQQLATFLDSITADRQHALFLLLATTGLRRGEALGLRWSDIDRDRSMLRVEQQLVVVGARTMFGPPKSRAGRRIVALSSSLIDALERQQQHQRRDLARDTDDDPSSGLGFTDPDGGALSPAAVSRRFQQLAKQANVPVIRLHDLRHTSASLGLASGESLLEVSRRLGHSSISITADVYSHVSPAAARDASERLARYIGLNKHDTP